MEVNTQKKSINLAGSEIETQGRWRLKVNRFFHHKTGEILKEKIKKFHLTNVPSFFHKGSRKKMVFMTERGPKDYLYLSTPKIVLDPLNPIDDHNIGVLIHHPQVMIEGMKQEDWRNLVEKGLKVSNPKFSIFNLDMGEDLEFELKENILRCKSILYNQEEMGIEKLKYISSLFKIQTRNIEALRDKKRKRQKYIDAIEKKITSTLNGEKNRELFLQNYEDFKRLEMLYYVDEMIRTQIIKNTAGLFHFYPESGASSFPVGSTKQNMINYFEDNQDLYESCKNRIDKFKQN